MSKEGIKQRAVMMGVMTGDMPDVDFIWSMQRADGGEACFGQGRKCERRDCRWRHYCVALDFYANTPLPIAEPPLAVGAVRDGCEQARSHDEIPSLSVDLPRQGQLEQAPTASGGS